MGMGGPRVVVEDCPPPTCLEQPKSRVVGHHLLTARSATRPDPSPPDGHSPHHPPLTRLTPPSHQKCRESRGRGLSRPVNPRVRLLTTGSPPSPRLRDVLSRQRPSTGHPAYLSGMSEHQTGDADRSRGMRKCYGKRAETRTPRGCSPRGVGVNHSVGASSHRIASSPGRTGYNRRFGGILARDRREISSRVVVGTGVADTRAVERKRENRSSLPYTGDGWVNRLRTRIPMEVGA